MTGLEIKVGAAFLIVVGIFFAVTDFSDSKELHPVRLFLRHPVCIALWFIIVIVAADILADKYVDYRKTECAWYDKSEHCTAVNLKQIDR